MWPDVVVVVTPKGQLAAGVGQGVEDFLIQAFVAQAAIEGLDIAVLLGLSGVDVMPLRVSGLLCMSDPVHASSKGSMHDDLQGTTG